VKLALVLALSVSLQTVLDRVSDYVLRYQRDLSSVVVEEKYVQDADKSDRPLLTHRELRSDLLLMKAQSDTGYVQFRDVFEVDGDAVRDRSDRLMQLFVHPAENPKKQAAQIMNESARYNIGRIERNINVPLLALLLLDPVYQPHFKYSVDTEHRGTPRGLPKTPAFTLPAEAWELDFDEIMSPTIIKGDLEDAKSHGRVWIDPDTGRVLITELVNEAKTVRSTIRVSFQSVPLDGFLLPVEMRERYERKGRFYLFEGTATYSNYRRFTVTTDESIKPPKD
jgi:hypothetical protein